MLHGAYTDFCIKRLAEPRSLELLTAGSLPAVPVTLANQTHGLQRQTFKVYRVSRPRVNDFEGGSPPSPLKVPKVLETSGLSLDLIPTWVWRENG